MTDKKDEALKLALQALEYISSHYMSLPKIGCMALAAVEEALAEHPAQQQEPVAYASSVDWRKNQLMSKAQYDNCLPKNRVDFDVPLYTSPPASKPLTDAQIGAVAADIWGSVLIAPQSYQTFARAIEAAHGIKE